MAYSVFYHIRSGPSVSPLALPSPRQCCAPRCRQHRGAALRPWRPGAASCRSAAVPFRSSRSPEQHLEWQCSGPVPGTRCVQSGRSSLRTNAQSARTRCRSWLASSGRRRSSANVELRATVSGKGGQSCRGSPLGIAVQSAKVNDVVGSVRNHDFVPRDIAPAGAALNPRLRPVCFRCIHCAPRDFL